VLFVGVLGNTEHPGKLVADMATVVGTTIVTVVDGDFGRVATSVNVLSEVVIVSGSHATFIPVCVPDGTVVYFTPWVLGLPVKMKVWGDASGWD